MGIGLGVILLVLGAIMKFTTFDSDLLGTNLDVVGIILMAGGVIALIMGVIQNGQRTNTSHTVVEERRGGPDVVERVERRSDPDVVERVERRSDPDVVERVERRDDGV
ncbi:MAG: DUF6458 family protein [Dermatophilaceae bacterium]